MQYSNGQTGQVATKQSELAFEQKRRLAQLRSIRPEDLGLTPEAWRTPRELLIQIELITQPDGCHAYVETLADRVGVTGRTIRNARRLLEEQKLLYVDENKHRRGGQGANQWHIQWDVVTALARRLRPETISGRPETISARPEIISGPLRKREVLTEIQLESKPPEVPQSNSCLQADQLARIDDASLRDATADWVAYKAERRQAYKPMGLKALVSQVLNKASIHGAEAVVEAMQKAAGMNWQGWDHDVGGRPARGASAGYKSRTETSIQRYLERKSHGQLSTGGEIGLPAVRRIGPPSG